MKVKIGSVAVDAPPDLEAVFRRAFPDYRGRKFFVQAETKLFMADTGWDGGSRSEYAFVRLADGAVVDLGDPISGGYAPNAREAYDALRSFPIPDGVAIVRRRVFCGKEAGLTLFARPDNLSPALAAGKEEK